MPNLWDFEGVWTIIRQIDDALSGNVGRFEGAACFATDGVGLRYSEKGVLTLGTTSMTAERVYLWRERGAGIEVLFEDGRAFHRIDGSAQAEHWCDPDQYDVSYDFSDWPNWSSRWQVKGPRKNYVMVSNYRR